MRPRRFPGSGPALQVVFEGDVDFRRERLEERREIVFGAANDEHRGVFQQLRQLRDVRDERHRKADVFDNGGDGLCRALRRDRSVVDQGV